MVLKSDMNQVKLFNALTKITCTTTFVLLNWSWPSLKASELLNIWQFNISNNIIQNLDITQPQLQISNNNQNNKNRGTGVGGQSTSTKKPSIGGQPTPPDKKPNKIPRNPCKENEPSLMALVVPSTETQKNSTSFTQENPRFWFYMPYESIQLRTAEFEISDDAGNSYKEDLKQLLTQTKVKPGFISVSVPSTKFSLKDGQWYQLKLSVDVSCKLTSRPIPDYVIAWVEKQKLNSTVSNQLSNAKNQLEKSKIFENNGLWYDALTTIAENKRSNPNDENWARLLRVVGLQEITTKEIVNCCSSGIQQLRSNN